ncbi:MAG: cupredoxin domain-containing protein [Longimicrobiales bacterium]
MSKRWQLIGLVAFALLPGCSDSTDPANDTRTVRMLAATFSPAEVTVTVGQSVTWTNDLAIAHTITPANPAQAGAWTNIIVPATTGFATAVRMDVAGTFNYSCTLHAGMNGRVIVQ